MEFTAKEVARIYLDPWPAEGYEGVMAIFKNEETTAAVTFYPAKGLTAEGFIDEMEKKLTEYDGLPIGNISFTVDELPDGRLSVPHSIECHYSEEDLPDIKEFFKETLEAFGFIGVQMQRLQ